MAPASILLGESATLYWNAVNASSATLEPDGVSVPIDGSMTVSPDTETTYSITVEGLDGTASADVTLKVNAPENIDYGGADITGTVGRGDSIGDGIQLTSGNLVESRTDVAFASPNRLGFGLDATYNSRLERVGAMGYGWTHTYEAALSVNGNKITIVDGTGRGRFFSQSGSVYQVMFGEKSHVTAEAPGYVWNRLDGSRFGFSSEGRLEWMDDAVSNRLELDYDDLTGQLLSVTDLSSTRQITFNYVGDRLSEIVGPVTEAVPDGVWVTYGYDPEDDQTSVSYADGSGFVYSYVIGYHNLSRKENAAGHLLNTWTYNSGEDRAVSSVSRDGTGMNWIEYEYDSENQVRITDEYNVNRTYTISEFAGRKRLTAMAGPVPAPYAPGSAVRWQYDANLNLTEVEYPNGAIDRFENHDARGNPQTLILAGGTEDQRTITYTYHSKTNAVLTRTEKSVLGSDDKITIFDHDDDGDDTPNEAPTNLIHRVVEEGYTADSTGSVIGYSYLTTFAYNAKGQVVSIDGPRDDVADIINGGYDNVTGDLETITQPLIGNTSFSGYDAAGRFGAMTDANGQITEYRYDDRGRETDITYLADGSSKSFEYGINSELEAQTDEDGVARTYTYDSTYGRLYRTFDAESNYIEYAYDSHGNKTAQSYHRIDGTITSSKTWDYNDQGLVWKEFLADNTYTEYGYDASGNLSAVTDPGNNTVSYTYDAFNRIADVTEPGSGITRYDYDLHGNLASVTDAESHKTEYTYDDLGRVVTIDSPDTGITRYVYDPAGNRIERTDANGIKVTYTYDDLNRITQEIFPDNAQNVSYAYDQGVFGNGQLTVLTDPSGSQSFSYDARGRMRQKTASVLGVDYPLTRVLTDAGRTEALIYPSGRTVDFERNACACAVDRVVTQKDLDTKVLVENMAYRPFGSTKALASGSGGVVQNEHDPVGRLKTANPGAERERKYTYDSRGNHTGIHTPSTPWLNEDFSYDALNRLITAQGPYGLRSSPTIRWATG